MFSKNLKSRNILGKTETFSGHFYRIKPLSVLDKRVQFNSIFYFISNYRAHKHSLQIRECSPYQIYNLIRL